MKNLALACAGLAACVALSGCTTNPDRPGRQGPVAGEERLERILKGRVAGEPVNCISLTNARNSRIIDRTAIVFDSGSVIYVNRPANPGSLDSDDIMITKPTGSQLCRLDTVQLRDRSQMFYSGFVALEQFVPYRKIR